MAWMWRHGTAAVPAARAREVVMAARRGPGRLSLGMGGVALEVRPWPGPDSFVAEWRAGRTTGAARVELREAASWATDVVVGVARPRGVAAALWPRTRLERIAATLAEEVGRFVEEPAVAATVREIPARPVPRPVAS